MYDTLNYLPKKTIECTTLSMTSMTNFPFVSNTKAHVPGRYCSGRMLSELY